MTGKLYENRVVRINLKTGEITKYTMDPKLVRQWIGGCGIAMKILYDEVGPEVKPLDPENKMVFQAGPFNGTKMPGSGTYQVSAKGPLTGYIINAQSNGYFGARMRHVGYETIILEDVCPEWSVLKISDEGITIEPAGDLVGQGCWDTEEKLLAQAEHKKNSVACIGPAGENLVSYASIFNDSGHIVATNGPGAVMGSKKLKAIMLSTDNNSIDTYEELKGDIRNNSLKAAEESGLGGMVKRVGTLGYFDNLPPRGGVPTKNYSTNVYDYEQFSAENREQWWDRKKTTCWACPWAHTGVVSIKKGKARGMTMEEPEFEPLAGFTTNMGNDDIGEGVRLCWVCESMGMDAKELSYVVSCVIECFEDGLITLEDTEGLNLSWGNTEAVDQLIQDIAHKRGFGAKCAGGVKSICEMIGGEAMKKGVYSGRGIAPNVVDERMTPMAYYNLTLSESGSFGGFAGQDPDVGNMEPLDMEDFRQIGWYLGGNSTKWVLMDAYGCCFFYAAGIMKPIIDALNACTGWDLTHEELYEAGERIKAIGRAYNIREGLTPEIEMAVSHRFSQPYTDGPMAGKITKLWDEETFRAFYERSGWDRKTSKPLPETLKRLDMEYLIPDLWGEQA